MANADLSEMLARALTDFAPDGLLVVDEAGTILSTNRRLCDLFGYTLDELVGQPVELLIPTDVKSVHRAHRTRYRAEPSIRTMGIGRTLKGRRRDGSELSVEVGLSPMESDAGLRVVAVVRDVSEQAELRAQAQLVQEAIDAVQDGVFIFDPETLRFHHVNQGAVQQTGYGREQLLTLTPIHLKPEFTEASFRELLEPLLAGGHPSVEFETVHRRIDGIDVPVEISLSHAPGVDATVRQSVVAVVRDITDRKASELRQVRVESLNELVSHLRLRLLGTESFASALQGVCDEIRASGLASDAVVIDVDDGQRTLTAWAFGNRQREESLGATGVLGTLGRGSAHGHETVVILSDSQPGLVDDDRQALKALDTRLIVAGPIGDRRALALLSDIGDIDHHDVEILGRLIRDVNEALALADARSDRQRMRLAEDRERIATDLHDVVIQRLFAAGMRLQAALPLVDDGAADRIQSVVTELDTTIGEIRDTIFGLHRSTEDGVALSVRITEVVQANEEYLGFRPSLVLGHGVDSVDESVAVQLVPALTEMLSNVARHAMASRVEVAIDVEGDELTLQVADDGIGIAIDAAGGRGLANLSRRAEQLGGVCQVGDRSPDGGTLVQWRVPLT